MHRRRLRKEEEYRRMIMEKCVLMRPFFALTQRINQYLQHHLLKEVDPSSADDTISSLNLSVLEESTVSVSQSRLSAKEP